MGKGENKINVLLLFYAFIFFSEQTQKKIKNIGNGLKYIFLFQSQIKLKKIQYISLAWNEHSPYLFAKYIYCEQFIHDSLFLSFFFLIYLIR